MKLSRQNVFKTLCRDFNKYDGKLLCDQQSKGVTMFRMRSRGNCARYFEFKICGSSIKTSEYVWTYTERPQKTLIEKSPLSDYKEAFRRFRRDTSCVGWWESKITTGENNG